MNYDQPELSSGSEKIKSYERTILQKILFYFSVVFSVVGSVALVAIPDKYWGTENDFGFPGDEITAILYAVLIIINCLLVSKATTGRRWALITYGVLMGIYSFNTVGGSLKGHIAGLSLLIPVYYFICFTLAVAVGIQGSGNQN